MLLPRIGSILCAIAALHTSVVAGVTDKLTVSLDGSPLPGTALETVPTVSANGRFIVYSGSYPNMAPGDTTATRDILVKDFATGIIEIVSRNTAGQQANNDCFYGSISSDGRFVAFASPATNLATPPSTTYDIYVRDRLLGTTVRVSTGPTGFGANQGCANPVISRNGRYVGFTSTASNLVFGDSSTANDAFVADRQTLVVKRASTDGNGITPFQGETTLGTLVVPSDDGVYAAFASSQPLLPGQVFTGFSQVLRKNLMSGVVEAVSVTTTGALSISGAEFLDMTPDGRFVYFESSSNAIIPNDTNGNPDAFLRDMSTGAVTRESVGNDGQPATTPTATIDGGRISSDGRFVTFDTRGVVQSLPSGVPQATAHSQVFLRDRTLGHTYRMSLSSSGLEPNSSSFQSSVSDDGSTVAFLSAATNLSVGDTTPVSSIWVYARWREGFKSLEMGKSGSFGIPQLTGTGDLSPGSAGLVSISSAAPNATTLFVLSLTQGNVPFYAGTFQAIPPLAVATLLTDANGEIGIPYALPPGALPVKRAFLQAAIVDPGAVAGVSATNLVSAVFP